MEKDFLSENGVSEIIDENFKEAILKEIESLLDQTKSQEIKPFKTIKLPDGRTAILVEKSDGSLYDWAKNG